MLVDLVNLQIWFLKLICFSWGEMGGWLGKLRKCMRCIQLLDYAIPQSVPSPGPKNPCRDDPGTKRATRDSLLSKHAFNPFFSRNGPAGLLGGCTFHASLRACSTQLGGYQIQRQSKNVQKLEERTNFLKEVKLIVAKKCN